VSCYFVGWLPALDFETMVAQVFAERCDSCPATQMICPLRPNILELFFSVRFRWMKVIDGEARLKSPFEEQSRAVQPVAAIDVCLKAALREGSTKGRHNYGSQSTPYHMNDEYAFSTMNYCNSISSSIYIVLTCDAFCLATL
jgi:hypothetical protein